MILTQQLSVDSWISRADLLTGSLQFSAVHDEYNCLQLTVSNIFSLFFFQNSFLVQ